MEALFAAKETIKNVANRESNPPIQLCYPLGNTLKKHGLPYFYSYYLNIWQQLSNC